MTSINRIDQAVLLLKDKLQRMQQRSAGAASSKTGRSSKAERTDPLLALRQAVRQGNVAGEDLRKALVRTLLSDAFGDEVAGTLEFQAIVEQVTRTLSDSESGRTLLARALTELS